MTFEACYYIIYVPSLNMVVGLADLISLEAEVAQLPGSSDEDSQKGPQTVTNSDTLDIVQSTRSC